MTDDVTILTSFFKIHSCSTLSELLGVQNELKDAKDPIIFLNLGVAFLQKDDSENAKQAFLNGIKLGDTFPNKYFNSQEIDTIGQCYAMLLVHFTVDNINHEHYLDNTIKITALAYIYLSRCIELLPNDAYDSYRTRAILFKDHTYYVIVNKLFSRYYEYPIMIEPFTLSDFYMCSNLEGSPHKEDITHAEEILNDIHDLADVVAKIDNKQLDEFSLEEMTKYGIKRHGELYKILKSKYEQGEFKISFNDVYETFNS